MKILTDRETGESRGIGFLTFETAEEAKKALTWDGTEIDGRWIGIKAMEPRPEGKGKGKGKGEGKGKGKGKGGKSEGPGEKPDGCTSVIITNLSFDCSEDQ